MPSALVTHSSSAFVSIVTNDRLLHKACARQIKASILAQSEMGLGRFHIRQKNKHGRCLQQSLSVVAACAGSGVHIMPT